jgi:tryptophan synthase beta chain
MTKNNTVNLPDLKGYFGSHGGSFLPPQLQEIMDEITQAYLDIKDDPSFIEELAHLRKHYIGRPSPIFFAKRLTKQVDGADIYLKREDLNHTGAHKINHCVAEALLAKKWAKKRLLPKQALVSTELPSRPLLPYLN